MFDLYFAGNLDVMEKYLKADNCNRLASQLLDRPVIDDWAETIRRGEVSSYLFVDSGAFTAHTKGTELDVDGYIEYINSLDDCVHVFAQVDKIPGVFNRPKTRQELLEAPELSWQNYLYMRQRVKSPDKLLPIFHQGEDFKWLHNMLETTFRRKHIPYIGISPANDKTVREKQVFIEECFNIIKRSSNPDVKTHAFGMTSLDLLERYPFTSADSTSWLLNGAMGSIRTEFGNVSVSDGAIKNADHYSKMPKQAQQQLEKLIAEKGFSLEKMRKSYEERIAFNIAYLVEWSRNYEFKSSDVKRKKLLGK
jgi:hypothetical protein